MTHRRIEDHAGQVHFVTFTCHRRRRLLEADRAKRIVLGVLNDQLAQQQGRCVGFVVMPDHVHAIVGLPAPEPLSHFLKQWKQRSSVQIKRHLFDQRASYAATIGLTDPVWEHRSYDFELVTDRKIEEKLAYMHANPVRAGLVARAVDWPWSSARHYEQGRTVGVRVGWPE